MGCERGLHRCSLFYVSVGQAQQEVDFVMLLDCKFFRALTEII